MSELAHGILLQDQGRLEEAEACFMGVLAREPENDYVHSRIALCRLSQEGKKKLALQSIDTAIQLKADNGYYHAIRSFILSDLNRGKDSLAAAEKAVSLDPEDAFTLTAKAAAYCSVDRWAEAEKWCREALAVDPDNSMAANILTNVLRLQGKSAENDIAVEKLLAANPEDSYSHINAGWSSLQKRDFRKAESHFREALRLDPESDAAREGLLESFRARSWFYRVYLSYCFFMQKFTGGRQFLFIIGGYVAYRLLRGVLEKINPLLALGVGLLWLGLVLWVWLAPGIGNFLILLDRSARLALRPSEKRQGIAVGGGLLLGILGIGIGIATGYAPAMLVGIGAMASTIPASLTFDNDSKAGRWVFGSITGLAYVATLSLGILEAVRHSEEKLSEITVGFGGVVLLSTFLCTWLGNIRSLRQATVE